MALLTLQKTALVCRLAAMNYTSSTFTISKIMLFTNCGSTRPVISLITKIVKILTIFSCKEPFSLNNDWELNIPKNWSHKFFSKTSSPSIVVTNDDMEVTDELSVGIESHKSLEVCEVELYTHRSNFFFYNSTGNI
jgi:hypothetical protein